METNRRQARFNSRITENTFLHLSAGPVVIGLFIRAGRDAIAPVAASVLIDENNTVLLPFIGGSGRASTYATGVDAVITYAGEIEVEAVFELERRFSFLVAHFLKIYIVIPGNVGTTGVIFPVHTPVDGNVFIFRDHGFGSSDRLLFMLLGRMQVIVGEGIYITISVVIRHFRHVGIEKEIGEHVGLAAVAKFQLIAILHPSSFPQILVFPLLRIADAWLGFHIVPPHVFGAFPVRPYILAGNRTGIAANTLLQVEGHAYLSFYFHGFLLYSVGTLSSSLS